MLTAVVLAGFSVDLGSHNGSVHLVLNTVDGCVALLVAYLVQGRWIRDRRVQDFMLVEVFVLLAVGGLGPGPALRAVLGAPRGTADVWLPASIRVVGSVLIVAAAVQTRGRVVRHA